MVIISTQYLGKVRGKSDGVVAQYLGIQYATILNRFAEATLNQTRDGGVLDATKNGYVEEAQDIFSSHFKMTNPLT